MKTLNQSMRYLVYQALDSLLARHRHGKQSKASKPKSSFDNFDEALRENNDEFLNGYIALVDGEKDPRNLMVAFSMDRVLCIEFDISKYVEGSTFCSQVCLHN